MYKWLAMAMLLGSCAHAPTRWLRADGKPPDQGQFAVDRTVCQGEMQKSAVVQREQKIYLLGERDPLTTIFAGCMAQHGYLSASE